MRFDPENLLVPAIWQKLQMGAATEVRRVPKPAVPLPATTPNPIATPRGYSPVRGVHGEKLRFEADAANR